MSKHIPHKRQLDSLRAIAVIAVISAHWLWHLNLISWNSYGGYGMRFFFVLSSFLLTRILILQKQSGEHRRNILKSFFYKRFIRLLPAYLTYLGVIFLLGLTYLIPPYLNNTYGYFLTFSANFLFFYKGVETHLLTHLWSLSVEEQFYLLLPWVILLFERNWQGILAGLFLTFSIIIIKAMPGRTHEIMVYGNSFYFVFGAIGATYLNEIINLLNKYRYWIYGALIVFSMGTGFLSVNSFIHPLFVSILFSIILINGFVGFKGVFKKFLEFKSMQYIGRISYGLYLYSNLAVFFALEIAEYLDFSNNWYLVVSISILTLFAMTLLSYYVIELPFLRQKSRFDK